MQSLQKQLASASNSLPCECAKPPQIEAFKAAIDQARSALEKLGVEVDALCDAVAKAAGLEGWPLVNPLGKSIGGIFVRIGGQGDKDFDFSGGFDPRF